MHRTGQTVFILEFDAISLAKTYYTTHSHFGKCFRNISAKLRLSGARNVSSERKRSTRVVQLGMIGIGIFQSAWSGAFFEDQHLA
jgi:hypothetical protein